MSEQMELLERPPELTRAAARKLAMDAARARAEVGADRAGAKADTVHADWCLLAAEKLRVFARAQGGVFNIEMARAGLGDELPAPPDLRAWGKATVMAIKAGYVEKVPRVFMPAASSNGAPKAAYRRGGQRMSKWMVYDSNGAIWPPGFKSEIHPEEEPKPSGLTKALQAANEARANGKGWGKGEIAHLVKPILPKTTA